MGSKDIVLGSECFAAPEANEAYADALVCGLGDVYKRQELDNAPDGSRYVIYIVWKQTDSAHVFIAQKDNGIIKYLDSQTGILDVGYYFAHGKPSNFGFYRIDDKPLAIMGPLSRPRSKILRVAVSRIILSSEASKVKLVGNLVA